MKRRLSTTVPERVYSLRGLGAVGGGVGTFLLVSAIDKREQADKALACDRTAEGDCRRALWFGTICGSLDGFDSSVKT